MNDSQSSGVGVSTVVGIVFVILKLVGTIDWSWWWVLSPFWIPWALLAVFALLAILVSVVSGD